MREIKINKVVRSRRRTIALIVTADATLVVRAPYHTPLEYIKNLVSEKSAWIARKLKEAKQWLQRPAPAFVNGAEFLFLGKRYELSIVEQAAAAVELVETGKLILAKRVVPDAREVLERWYRAEARKKIAARCQWYAERTGCKPSTLRITGARKRWGSCGAKGTLNFSWRLVMAPQDVIDYVVVHELAHIGQMDHSKLFWDKVRRIMPDYERQRQWLRDNERLLTF